MSAHVSQTTFAESDLPRRAIERVLVVDDSKAQRRVLVASLRRQGFTVLEAGSGEEALALLSEGLVDLILSDWMMPGMTGLQLCQLVRDLPLENYIYFILLTSKNETGAVTKGLEIGADDFLTKPVGTDELRARIKAGDRILRMQRELADKNRLITSALDEIQTLYEAVDRDLVEARKMQQSLLRERWHDFGTAEISLLLKPSGHVGGDLVGHFRAGENRIAVYSIDVSGHGIASALMTSRLAGYLSDGAPDQNIALVRDTDGRYLARPPFEVATLLNALMLEEIKTDLYITFAIGYLDLTTGRVDICQCGHPNPAVLKADGSICYQGRNGLPIGLFEDAEYEQWHLDLAPGDRLLFYSDGFTECPGDADTLLGEDGLAQFVLKNAGLRADAFFEALVWDLDLFHGGADFADDLSCAMIEFHGEGRNQAR